MTALDQGVALPVIKRKQYGHCAVPILMQLCSILCMKYQFGKPTEKP